MRKASRAAWRSGGGEMLVFAQTLILQLPKTDCYDEIPALLHVAAGPAAGGLRVSGIETRR
ncbi:MAG: hypothetical protein OHK0039_37710 [Bacteroidia bacterium]